MFSACSSAEHSQCDNLTMPKENHIGDHTPTFSLFHFFFGEDFIAQGGKFCHPLTHQGVPDLAHPALYMHSGGQRHHTEEQWLQRSSSGTQLCAETFQVVARKTKRAVKQMVPNSNLSYNTLFFSSSIWSNVCKLDVTASLLSAEGGWPYRTCPPT